MPLQFVKNQDIFQSSMQTLACPVNTVGVMGAGLAKTFKNNCSPDMFLAYKRLCDMDAFSVRSLYTLRSGNGYNVLLFPTKYHWKQSSDINLIKKGLIYLKENYPELEITSLALPKLGCGLGNLDWVHQVRPLVKEILSDITIPVLVLE